MSNRKSCFSFPRIFHTGIYSHEAFPLEWVHLLCLYCKFVLPAHVYDTHKQKSSFMSKYLCGSSWTLLTFIPLVKFQAFYFFRQIREKRWKWIQCFYKRNWIMFFRCTCWWEEGYVYAYISLKRYILAFSCNERV